MSPEGIIISNATIHYMKAALEFYSSSSVEVVKLLLFSNVTAQDMFYIVLLLTGDLYQHL